MKTGKKSLSVGYIILFIYIGVVVIRYMLAELTSGYPTVGIDEFLYYSLGRSIATEGKLLFRGQPADYSFILYPLVLSPVYLLFREGADYYRLIQLWNIILMSTSVFPIFALCRAVLKQEKKALVVTSLCMLLPDFILGQYVFSEAILYPLFFLLMFSTYRYLDEKKTVCLLLIGVAGGLMFSTKPGSALPAGLILAFALISALVNREKKNALFSVYGIAAALIVSGFFWCIARFAFGYRGELLSIYSSQVSDSVGWHLDAFFKALATYPYYFILSCGIIGFVYVVSFVRGLPTVSRMFWRLCMLSLLLTMIGTAWLVNRTEFLASFLHMRYIAMYIPIVLIYCFLPAAETREKGTKAIKNRSILLWPGILLAYTVLATLIWGCKVGAQTNSIYSSLSLAVLVNHALPLSRQIIGNIIIILLCIVIFCIFAGSFRKGFLQKLCIISMIAFMLLNGILDCAFARKTYSKTLAEDGLEVHRLTGDEKYIYLHTLEGTAEGGIDVNTRKNSDIVFLNDFINYVSKNNGCYLPFVPEKVRGFSSEKLTEDVNTLVLDNTCYPMIKLSPYADADSPFQHNNFFVVHFTPGERLFDSTIGNVKNKVLSVGTPGILLFYDPALVSHPITISFDIESSKSQVMKIFCSRELQTIDLKEGRDWYEVTFSKPEDAFNFTVEEADIKLHAYKVEPVN